MTSGQMTVSKRRLASPFPPAFCSPYSIFFARELMFRMLPIERKIDCTIACAVTSKKRDLSIYLWLLPAPSTLSLMHDYDPSSIEPKWQKRWEEAGAYRTDLSKAKKPYYSLVMFPYPSGDKLHVGHWYNFAPADSWSRYKRMHGHQVFAPMGFDAFGLPAENYAIKTGVPPATSIAENVRTMTAQLKK